VQAYQQKVAPPALKRSLSLAVCVVVLMVLLFIALRMAVHRQFQPALSIAFFGRDPD
jgi:hypothetical protein